MPDQLLTVITISQKVVSNRVLSPTTAFYNHVCTYRDTRDIVRQKLAAIAEIETPYYLFLNENDDTPMNLPLPSDDCGILLGDMYQNTGGSIVNLKGSPFKSSFHLKNPLFLTRAICRKDYTLELAAKLTDYDVWFEFLYGYALGRIFGAQYDERYICSLTPEKLSSGNLNYLNFEKNTRLWLARNIDDIKKKLVY